MVLSFTPEDARLLFGFLASIVVPFIVALIKRAEWSGSVKLMLAIFVSVIAALLSQYIAGALVGTPAAPVSLVAALIGVFVAGQTHYATWFSALGLDAWLAPSRGLEGTTAARGRGL